MATKKITNPDMVEFKAPLIYNLARVRAEGLKLAARTNGNKDQFEAVMETLDTLRKFAKDRYEVDVAAREEAARTAEANSLVAAEAAREAEITRLQGVKAKGVAAAREAAAALKALTK